jgi:SRSO17 transposase
MATTSGGEAWAEGFEGLPARLGPRFGRIEARRRLAACLRGLLAPLERKNGWRRAEAAGDPTPDGVQGLLGRVRWDADAVRDDLRAYVGEHLGDPGGVLVLDETGFIKKGRKSAGV